MVTLVIQDPVILVTVTGDSIFSLTNTNGANGWTTSAIAQLNADYPGYTFGMANMAVGGTTTAQHYAQALASIANTPGKCLLKFGLWEWWSPNDGGTAAAMTAAWSTYFSETIALTEAAGFIPVLATCIPCSADISSGSDDAQRISYNNQVRAMASASVIVADFDVVMTNGATPVAAIQSSYTTNGLHPDTPAGQAAMWPVLSGAIEAWLTAHGY